MLQGWNRNPLRMMGIAMAMLVCSSLFSLATGQFGTPKEDEGTRIFKATEHPYYSGQFHLSGQKALLIGSMRDSVPWDHMDYTGKRVVSVHGTIEIKVNELTNSGQIIAEFAEGSDRYRIVFARFAAKAPFQDGALRPEFTNMATPGTVIPCIPKHGSISGGGEPPACSRTMRCSIRIMMRTSW